MLLLYQLINGIDSEDTLVKTIIHSTAETKLNAVNIHYTTELKIYELFISEIFPLIFWTLVYFE